MTQHSQQATAEAAFGSPVDRRAPSVAHMLLDRVAASPDREAFRYPHGDGWRSVSWRVVGDRVRRVAAGLIALGVSAEDRVAIASSTRYEWVLADLGIVCSGAATTTVYPATGPEDLRFILADSQSVIIFAEDDAQVDKIRAHRAGLPALRKVVTFDGGSDGDWVIGLADLERLGEELLASRPTAVETGSRGWARTAWPR
jgi:long-chain acyl-CoA synthetase